MKVYVVDACGGCDQKDLSEVFWDLESAKSCAEEAEVGDYSWEHFPHGNDVEPREFWSYGAVAVLSRTIRGGALTGLAHCAEEDADEREIAMLRKDMAQMAQEVHQAYHGPDNPTTWRECSKNVCRRAQIMLDPDRKRGHP